MMRSISKLVFPALALTALAACSSKSDPPANPAVVDAGPGDTGAPSTDVTLSMKLTINPGEEVHRCQLVQLPPGELWVNGLEHSYTKGSHHFLMYATTLKSIPAGEEGQTECPNGDEGPFKYAAGLVYATQTAEGKVPFPDGVGMHLDSGSVFMIQSHYLNPNKTPIDATVKLTFKTTTADKVKVRAAPFLFFDPFIYLPAKSTGKSMTQSCGVPQDVTLLTAFSHYHQRGTKMTVWKTASADAPTGDVIYTSNDWENPNLLAAPVNVKKGEHIRFQCEYDNTMSDTEVVQGPRPATNEMCVFVGIYYPEIPRKPDAPFGSDFSQCGTDRVFTETGSKYACIDLAQCLQTCPASDAPRFHPGGVDIGMCWQRCANDACPKALSKVFPLSGCQASQCAAECKSADTCLPCIATKCSKELEACQAHSCPAK